MDMWARAYGILASGDNILILINSGDNISILINL